MAYELRLEGQASELFVTTEAALRRVRSIIRNQPDADPEIVDTRTGRAFEPAASKDWREELARKLGY